MKVEMKQLIVATFAVGATHVVAQLISVGCTGAGED